ncbi:MAG: Cytidylate kinase [Patescibacteria group bacterium]|nr:Cytidylate kinase [Patescibacteria group bacterium]
MPERLAIVTIDAGSDVRGRVLDQERVGTSSGKGTMADAIRQVGGLAYDSGCAYRSITLRAMMEGLSPDDEVFRDRLVAWDNAGNFGHSERGLSLFGMDVHESVLHGGDVSNRVASFGSSSFVRTYTKHMKVKWLEDFASKWSEPLVAFDGREMRQFVQERVLGKPRVGADLLASLVMVVDPIEAAHRRMSSRGEVEYGEKGWQVHPALVKTHEELRKRALQDEDRPVDGVGMPDEFVLFNEQDGRLSLAERHNDSDLEDALAEGVPIVLDTTGVNTDNVTRTGLNIIARGLMWSESEAHKAMARKINEIF